MRWDMAGNASKNGANGTNGAGYELLPSVWHGDDAELLERMLDFYPRRPPESILDATVNKGRFWVEPLLSVSYLAMNTQQPLFKDNVQLRKAVANAIDRRALLNQSGFLAGKRTDHILPPGLVGVKPCKCYSLKGPNVKLAKKLTGVRAKAFKQGFVASAVTVATFLNNSAIGTHAETLSTGLVIRF